MSEAEFKSGDTVCLKSGGPTMTIDYIRNDSGKLEAYCAWFAGDRPEKAFFAVAMLKKE